MASPPNANQAPATVPVSACQLRPGDMVAMCEASDLYTPDLCKVVRAEYSPVGGCIAFFIGFEDEPGGVRAIPTPGWGHPGHYSWTSRFYTKPEDAERINARPSLFDEAYPELA